MFGAIGVARPHARQKIGLQFQSHRQFVVFGLADPAAGRLDTIGNPEQILNMMTHFVCDDVSLREITAGPESIAKRAVKSEVDINAPVFRTIKGTARGAGEAATGPGLSTKEDEFRLFVLATHLLKDCLPCVLGIGENDRNEFRSFIAWSVRIDLARRCNLRLLL